MLNYQAFAESYNGRHKRTHARVVVAADEGLITHDPTSPEAIIITTAHGCVIVTTESHGIILSAEYVTRDWQKSGALDEVKVLPRETDAALLYCAVRAMVDVLDDTAQRETETNVLVDAMIRADRARRFPDTDGENSAYDEEV